MPAPIAKTREAAEDFADPQAARIVGFLRGLGFEIEATVLAEDAFVPGVVVSAGRLLVDPSRLTWPGDLLHEAGHIAVGDPERREDGVSDDPGEEMAAIAWSFAAAVAMDLDPAVLFHDGGYRGGGAALRENFSQGRYVGVPLLAMWGLTIEPHRAAPDGPSAYPHMRAWRRS